MLVLESQEFDLNTLFSFSFDSLKQILLKLAKSQSKLEEEMKNMKQNISIRDDIIFNLKNEIFKNNNNTEKDLNNIIENTIQEKKEKEKEKIEEILKNNNLNLDENKIETNSEINNVENIDNINPKEFEKKILHEKENIKKSIEKEEIDEKNNIKITNDSFSLINNLKYSQNNNKNNINENIIKEKFEENISSKNDNQKNNIIEISNNNNNINQQFSFQEKEKEKAQSSPNDLFSEDLSKCINQIKELNDKIYSLENKLASKDISLQIMDNKIKNNLLDGESKIKLINEKINKLLQNSKNLSEKIEKLEVKTSDMDIFKMFKDNGDGNIDTTKVLVKSLEEKVSKKFELLDLKFKKDEEENYKVKTTVENMIPKVEKIDREIEKINEVNKQSNEEFILYKKETIDKINLNINDINDDINKKIKEIKNEIDKNIKNKISNMDKNINNLMNKLKDNNDLDLLKLSLGNNVDPEKIEIINKKINDIRTKMNDIENTLKLHLKLNNEIDLLKNELKDMKLFLDKKITKDDLKELYNFSLNIKDEINDIKDRESITNDDLVKNNRELQNLKQKVESINGNLSLILDNPKNEMKMIDFNKYIDDKKFTDTLKPIIKEIDKIYKEIDSLKKDLYESGTKNTNSIKSAINLIEDDINNKINDFKNFIQKRYLEKFEFHKAIKTLEIQIKSNMEDKKQSDAENWLLAKKNINCFNCASCEANIKNGEYNPAEYLAWKKYPQGEKIHRMGQGFSHMLQMMTSEFIKNIEKNEFQNENESSSRNSNNFNLNTSPSYNHTEMLNINSFFNNIKDKDDIIGFKKKTKFKLPKMNQSSKNKIKLINADNLPISDDENIIFSDTNRKETHIKKDNDDISPKILKITKKSKAANIIEMAKSKGKFKNLVNHSVFTPRDKNKDLDGLE